MKSASIRAAGANGIQLLKRTKPSCSVGLSRPGNSCSSSSRGEKARPAFGADAIFATQLHFVTTLRLYLPRLAALRTQGALTRRTARALGGGRFRPIRLV